MPDGKCILDPERDCLGLIKARELEKLLEKVDAENDETHRRIFERLESQERHVVAIDEKITNIGDKLVDIRGELREINGNIAELMKQLPPLEHRVNELEEDSAKMGKSVAELKEKPAKRWDNMVGQIIGLVVAALVGVVLARLGM